MQRHAMHTHTRVELPRASASPDWWRPRRGETDIKSTNLSGSRSTIRLERGRMSRGGAISRCPPFLCCESMCIGASLAACNSSRGEPTSIAQHWWWWWRYCWRGTDADCGRDGRGILHFATMHTANSDSSRLSLPRDLWQKIKISIKAIFS